MRRLFCSFLLPFGVAACSETGVSSTLVPETALAVDPSEFLQGVTCEPGQMQSYVATVVDMSPFFDESVRAPGVHLGAGIDEFALPSSGPTPCFQRLLFQRIVVGRQYRVEVDGYDRAAVGTQPPGTPPEVDDIRPLAVGSRIMIDGTIPGNYVAPRWRTTCNHYWSAPHTQGGSALTDGSAVARDGGALTDRNAVTRDGGAVTDGSARVQDAGRMVDGSAAMRFPDAAVQPYDDCRGNRFLDAGPDGEVPRPWLGGPVCAQTFQTITFTACDPIVDTGAAK